MDRAKSPQTGPAAPTTLAAVPPFGRPWLAHYSAAVPAAVDVPAHPVTWLLDRAAAEHGGNTAMIYFGTRISYTRFLTLAERFADGLRALGVRRGDRVSICLPNLPAFPIAFYGALKVGAVVVPTNPLYTPPELEHQLRDAGVRVVVMLEQVYPMLAAVRARTSVEHVILAGVADHMPRPLAIAYRLQQARAQRRRSSVGAKALRADPSIHNFMDVTRREPAHSGAESEPAPTAVPDEVAVLQYTGGTTGVAKGAMLTHRNLVANATQAWSWNEQPLSSQHASLCVAPFFHVYGLTVGMNMTILNGSTMVLLPRFTVKDTLKAIRRYRPDLFPGVPTMYLALAREAERARADLRSVKICISGSAPLPLEVQQHFERVSGARVVEGYGLTEASPVTHCNPVFGARHIGTIGLPMPSTDAAIINPETWTFVPPGEQGEIVVRGPQVMAGYWQRADETANVLRDGWLRTGDIGMMDAEGYFTIADRAKDIIIASGYKIFPKEIEDVLYQYPQILEAAVIGVPDTYRGETVRACIVPKPGEHVRVEDLTAFCKERLAAYKVPKQFVFRKDLPKSLIGKVLRRELREQAAAEMRGDAGASDEAPAPS